MKTLNEILHNEFTWKQNIAKNHMYKNIWYDGKSDYYGDLSMRFLFYTLRAPITKVDLKCFPLYKKKSFPLIIEIDGYLGPSKERYPISGIYGIGTEEYYALFEQISKNFEKIQKFYHTSCCSVHHILESMTISYRFNVTGKSMMLYEYDYVFVNTLLSLTKENKIHWTKKEYPEYVVYTGDIDMVNGTKTTIEIRPVWIEAENQCGRDPYLYKITSPLFTRVFFLGTKIGSMIYEIISIIGNGIDYADNRIKKYIQYVTLMSSQESE